MESVSQAPMITKVVQEALDDLKAIDVTTLEVAQITTLTDAMIIASGSSLRHVQSIAEAVRLKIKQLKYDILGYEGLESGEWVILDLGDVIVHIMQPQAREYYALEKLWSVDDTLLCASKSSP